MRHLRCVRRGPAPGSGGRSTCKVGMPGVHGQVCPDGYAFILTCYSDSDNEKYPTTLEKCQI